MSTEPATQPVKAAPPPVRPRVTVTENVYLAAPGSEPHNFGRGYHYQLDTDEQPYVRHLTVGEGWVPLDHGWLPRASLLVLVNTEGKAGQTYPTEAEKAATQEKVVELTVYPDRDPIARVRPGRSCRFEPNRLDLLRLRCRKGTARITVMLVPE